MTRLIVGVLLGAALAYLALLCIVHRPRVWVA